MKNEIRELIMESYEIGNITLEEASILMETVESDEKNTREEELDRKIEDHLARRKAEKKEKRKKALKTAGKIALGAGALGATAYGSYRVGRRDGYTAGRYDADFDYEDDVDDF